jgi:hypothetical protein
MPLHDMIEAAFVAGVDNAEFLIIAVAAVPILIAWPVLLDPITLHSVT